ncbi:hypothetical protein HC752_01785 [Vibrio sp. S9_S30]|uniref:hypothetical protein n=1 Tax=Vibrio sp. S9_S30 TaxID=2720226 RepID=UPI001681B237|nr:hypothetical protein [Vibrio sp. S9_S30]MBD1555665.1 hypothetical protein [Vibrio sp. S9_S30]
MTVVPLDMPYELYDSLKLDCDRKNMMKGKCKDKHVIRNEMWSRNLGQLLKNGYKVVSFMHHYHSVVRWKKDVGVRTLVREQGYKAVVINMIGGAFCSTESEDSCSGGSKVEAPYNKKRFYIEVEADRNKDYAKANYQVHLPQVREPRKMR